MTTRDGLPPTSTPPRRRRLIPTRLEDWPAMVRHTNVRPSLDGRPPTDAVVQAQFRQYIHGLGPIPTRDTRAVAAAVDAAHEANDASWTGPQRCVVIDGHPHSGKTYAALTKAFEETRQAWHGRSEDTPGIARSIPWAYVEVPPKAQTYSLYQAILAFCGMPHTKGTRANATELADRLRTLAPQIGLRGVIIDDSHGIAGTDSRYIADILKTVVTGIPATVVIIGAGLRRRGVFDSLPGDQVRARANWVDVGDWPTPSKTGELGPWAQLVGAFARTDPLPDPDAKIALNTRSALIDLAVGSGHRPGTALQWLKGAAIHAMTEGGDLDLAALKATQPRT